MREMEILFQELFEAAGAGRRQGEQLAAAEGQTQARWQTLWMVGTGPLTVPQVARRLGVTRQNVQRTVTELIAEGLIAPTDNPDHRTSPLVQLTEVGQATLARINRRADASHRGMLEHFTVEDIDALRALLQRFTHAVRAVDAAPAGSTPTT